MLSLGAWRMGLGCSGEILPSPPSSTTTRQRRFQAVQTPCQRAQGQNNPWGSPSLRHVLYVIGIVCLCNSVETKVLQYLSLARSPIYRSRTRGSRIDPIPGCNLATHICCFIPGIDIIIALSIIGVHFVDSWHRLDSFVRDNTSGHKHIVIRYIRPVRTSLE